MLFLGEGAGNPLHRAVVWFLSEPVLTELDWTGRGGGRGGSLYKT